MSESLRCSTLFCFGTITQTVCRMCRRRHKKSILRASSDPACFRPPRPDHGAQQHTFGLWHLQCQKKKVFSLGSYGSSQGMSLIFEDHSPTPSARVGSISPISTSGCWWLVVEGRRRGICNGGWGGGGCLEPKIPKVCVPKRAKSTSPFVKLHFSRYEFRVRGGGGGVRPPPSRRRR